MNNRSLFYLVVTISTILMIPTSMQAQAVATGKWYSLFVCSNGTVMACGINSKGQLGDGTIIERHLPVSASSLNNVKAVAGGMDYSLFLRTDGTVWGVGHNNGGQIGDGTKVDKTVPVPSSYLNNIISVSAGLNHSLFLKADGTVWASGGNFYGQLCNGNTLAIINPPAQIPGLGDIVAVSAGHDHSIFLKSDGTVWTAGRNMDGQLGNGTNSGLTGANPNPYHITSLSNIIGIAAGQRHSLFLRNDGTVWACGSGGYGQLGDSSFEERDTPVMVCSLSNVVAIAAAASHSLFLKSDGTVWGCGYNGSGQLGDGTFIQTRNVPVQAIGLTGIKGIAATFYHSLFIQNNGTFWACGQNYHGEIAADTIMKTAIPLIIPALCVGPNLVTSVSREQQVSVYPNPNSGQFTIELPHAATKRTLHVHIYNGLGAIVYTIPIQSGKISLDLSKESGGIYYYKVLDNKDVIASGKLTIL